MASTPERILSWIVACVFTLAGVIKVTNLLPAAHTEMVCININVLLTFRVA